MSEAKFTPAPWVIIKQDDYEAIDNDELNLNVCTFTSRADDASHDQALIAAAPDMYKEIEDDVKNLKSLLMGVDPSSLESAAIEKKIHRKQKLLAKARGEHD